MNPDVFSVITQERSEDRRLHLGEFRRILALAWPFRGKLALGLVATLLFASLHTVSIGSVLPVFKLLLEQEGVHDWVNRVIAGDRLDLELAPVTDPAAPTLCVTRIGGDNPLYGAGLREFQRIRDAAGRGAAEFLGVLADAPPGTSFSVLEEEAGADSARPLRRFTLQPGEVGTGLRLLRWVSSLIPRQEDGDKLRTLLRILIGLTILIVAANAFRYAGEVLVSEAILRVMMDLRALLYVRTLHLPMGFFSARPTADIVARFVQDVQEVQRGLLTLFGKILREPLRALFILGLAFTLDWRMTLTIVIVGPVTVGRRVKKANRKLLQAYGAMIGALTASLQNLRIVKAYTAEDQERKRLWGVDLRVFRQQFKLAKLQAFISPMMETLAIIVGSLVTLWLASRVLNHELSPSGFATLGLALTVLFDPLRKVSDVYVRVQRATAGLERIFQVIDRPVESDLADSNVELKRLERSIDYCNVVFTYPGAETPVLKDVSLSIRQGETVAIVGPNGCGKTTLVSMLPRFFNPDSGEIRYDGVDLRQATLESLRAQISLVTQEAIVFAGTPVENIAYGVGSADRSRAEDAARRAYADEFIRKIPGGYEAVLGERGTTLSGGQQQRLAIARAIFRDAPILVFDEATSQIDTESEQKIQNALREFSQGRTTLIIAHRLSTIQFASRIIVMDAGRVIDSGSHKELFDRCPLYRNLCETQFVTSP